jgi:hypothetical protein
MSVASAMAILAPAAVVGFGVVTATRVAQRVRQSRRPLPPARACIDTAWARPGRIPPGLVSLPLPAVLTLSQFPQFHLRPEAAALALETLMVVFDAATERQEGGLSVIEFPGLEGSALPDVTQVVVGSALARVQAYQRYGAAVAASVLAPACAWPEPMSEQLPEEPKEEQVWLSLMQLSVVVLAQRDGVQIPVDVDPVATHMEDELDICVPQDVVLELRNPTTLAPEIGVDDDESWPISHAAQISVYEGLLAALADPLETAPVSRAVVAVAPNCPWDDKSGYGLDMTTLWYAARRLERIANLDNQGGAP